MDEKNYQARKVMKAAFKEASTHNVSLSKIKALEERTRHLENLMIEKEAVSHDSNAVRHHQEI